jgi:hypothetical protein
MVDRPHRCCFRRELANRKIFKGCARKIAAATEAPRGERSHSVGAHVAEGHGG